MTYQPRQFRSRFETPFGQNMWAFLTQPETLIRLERASELGAPALKLMGARVLDAAGQGNEALVRDDFSKQMIGHMVRQIMEARGFALVRANQKFVGDPLFSSAARYALTA